MAIARIIACWSANGTQKHGRGQSLISGCSQLNSSALFYLFVSFRFFPISVFYTFYLHFMYFHPVRKSTLSFSRPPPFHGISGAAQRRNRWEQPSPSNVQPPSSSILTAAGLRSLPYFRNTCTSVPSTEHLYNPVRAGGSPSRPQTTCGSPAAGQVAAAALVRTGREVGLRLACGCGETLGSQMCQSGAERARGCDWYRFRCPGGDGRVR